MNENYIRERIFELIDASDISASHLCEELHLNKGYFADVRREKQDVPYDILVRICDYFGISLSTFFDREYSLKDSYREINILCQKIPEDQLETVIIPILKKFAEQTASTTVSHDSSTEHPESK